MVRIDFIESRQIPGLVSLVREFAEFEKLGHICEATEASLSLALLPPESTVSCLVAEDDGVLVGYAIFYPVFKSFRGVHTMYLEDLYVTPDSRGKGIGLDLLKRVARNAAERGIVRLDWQALEWNSDAIGFYDSLGAEQDSGNIDFRLYGDSFQKLLSE